MIHQLSFSRPILVIVVQGHPTESLARAYGVCREVFEREGRWYIESIEYRANPALDTDSMMTVRARLKGQV